MNNFMREFFNSYFITKQMAKKNPKKSSKEPEKKSAMKKRNSKTKLYPGKKQCKSCGNAIPIHKKVCGECGHVHLMKRSKQEVMKSLSKITPIIIKNIIENDDFNQFKGWSQQADFSIGSLVSLPQQLQKSKSVEYSKNVELKALSRRKSTQAEKHQQNAEAQANCFKQTNNKCFSYIAGKKPISCMGASAIWFAFVQSLRKNPTGLQLSQQLTIQAYNLHNYHLVGQVYSGECNLYFSNVSSKDEPSQFVFDKLSINRHISQIKIYSNIVAALTGELTLLIFTLSAAPKRKKPETYILEDQLELIQPKPDAITSYEFLRSSVESEPLSVLLAVGTMFGQLAIYRVKQKQYTLIRHIAGAHNEMITSISECPLNTCNEVLFATGCYDGTMRVWNLYEEAPIFAYESSNRKIWSIHWDPGAKFIFINRDEILDSCILVCFYSINKIDSRIHLANTVETRTVRNQKSKSLTCHDFSSKSIAVLDPVCGVLKMLLLEQLRSNSLKKKKPKKEEGLEKYFKINLPQGHRKQGVTIREHAGDQEQQNEGHLNKDVPKERANKNFPIYSDICMQSFESHEFVYISSFDGTIIVYKNDTK